MQTSPTAASFLGPPEDGPQVRRMFAEDTADLGYVMNLTRMWGHLPEQHEPLFELVGAAASAASLTFRERGVLISAAASTLGDSYCALAWGQKLADVAGVDLVLDVLTGSDQALTEREQALAGWARLVTADPSSSTAADVEALRRVGYDDAQVLAITLFVALRVAFSTVNDALGARPDRELVESVPSPVRAAVTWGRPAADSS